MFADFVEFTLPTGTRIGINRIQVINVRLTYNWRNEPYAPTPLGTTAPIPDRRLTILEVMSVGEGNNNDDLVTYGFEDEETALRVFRLILTGVN